MKAVLLSVHVVAAVVLIGPITVAASVFPRYMRLAARPATATAGRAVAVAMHRITRGYAVPALAVPVFGIGIASALGVLTQGWVLASMALTALAAAVLAAGIIPGQRRVLLALRVEQSRIPGDGDPGQRGVTDQLRRLAMITGGFALVWVVVVVLMILRPGSTTGV